MEKFAESLTGGVRRFAMAGVGAIAIAIDKSKEIIAQLVARGEATAAEGHVACNELQQRMTDQLSAFTQKLRADYETASFEQMLQKCAKLTPEQKSILIGRLNASEPEEAAAFGAEGLPVESANP